jgi:sterol 3beta-glucosyltransferase
MRLVALTYGTEGDTRPLAALCRALMDTGHDVTLLANSETSASVRELGVPHVALAGEIRGEVSSVIGKEEQPACHDKGACPHCQRKL